MSKLYRIKSRSRQERGSPCYVIRNHTTLGTLFHQWAEDGRIPSKLPAREAMESLMQLQKMRVREGFEWELEAADE